MRLQRDDGAKAWESSHVARVLEGAVVMQRYHEVLACSLNTVV